MAPRRKRQRLSEDGAEAVTAIAADEEPVHVPVPASASKKAGAHKQLFVRSLATTVTSDDLTEYFSENFPIKHALVVLDKESKESKGYGFVTFADAEDAQRAKEELDGTSLKGKKIKIELAESRHRDTEGEVPGVGGLSAGAKAKADRELQKKENQTPKLIVRNLPWSIKTPEELQKLFRSYGKCHFVKLPKLPSGELRGFGFVALRGKKNAEKAMAQLNGKEIDGRQIAVDWAVDKETWQDLQKKPEKDLGAEDDDSDAPSSVVSSDSEDDDEDSDEDNEDGSNTDYEDVSDSDGEGGVALDEDKPKTPEYTVFIRNLPFTADDDSLFEHFQQFGPIGYARVVLDRETERPKGTGFVRFVKEEDMINCLKGVPRVKLTKATTARRDGTEISTTHSVLEDQDADPTGKYTMDGRILHLSQAVDRSEATRLTAESAASRFARDKDKRRLYLLSEGTIDSNSPLYQNLSPSEIKMREESATLRRKQIQENPSLHLSLTRLSIRNIPRSTTSKDLKALARKAVVGFAADVKANKRNRLSKEELLRGGVDMMNSERARKAKGKGIVKQAKVVFETPAGSKIDEETSTAGAGRSRGYGFIEYYTHRSALMGLRWLNGHAVEYKVKGEQPKSKKAAAEAMQDKKKRLIVEFAIENANVVARRSDRETKARDPAATKNGTEHDGSADANDSTRDSARGGKLGKKRKRDSGADTGAPALTAGKQQDKSQGSGADNGKDAGGKVKKRMGIIQKKREARRARKKERA
jgi:nucleolar protein 4